MASAVVLGLALAPLADLLNRHGLPNTFASLAAVAFLLLMIVAAGSLVVVPAVDLIEALPQFIRRLNERTSSLLASFAEASRMLEQIAGKAEDTSGTGGSLRDGIQAMVLHTPSTMLQGFITIMLTYFMLEARLRVRR